jgi:hypothetical protein
VRAIIGRPAHNDGVGEVLIDLGEQHGRLPASAASRPRPHPFRTGLAGLATLLVLLLGGSVAGSRPVRATIVPGRLGVNMFVEQNRLYVVSPGPALNDAAVQKRVVSMYALPGGALLSRTTAAVTGAIFQVTSTDDLVLITYQVDTLGAEATLAVAAGTDRVLWRAPARLLSVAPEHGLALLQENQPLSGKLRWFGVDLRSGRTRWSFEQPAQGYTAEARGLDDFPRELITATVAGRIEIRDTRTGALVAASHVSAPPGWSWRGISVWPTGDLILVGGTGGITAYARADLSERWHNTQDLSGAWVRECAGMICLIGYRGGIRVLDTRTGRVSWAGNRWTRADPVWPYLLLSGDQGLEGRYPLAVVDPVTGVVHGDFGAWQTAGSVRADGTVVGRLQRIGDDVVFYALLDPAALAVHVLGAATGVSGDCRATTEVLVCRRIDASVAIWPLSES